jgi:hypothetical protein
MTIPTWISVFSAAFAPSRRYEALFSMSNSELAARGYDRAGLQRAYISGFSGF